MQSVYEEGHKIEILQLRYLQGDNGGCNLITLGSDQIITSHFEVKEAKKASNEPFFKIGIR